MSVGSFSGNGTGRSRRVGGGRLELLVPHLLRAQLLRPGSEAAPLLEPPATRFEVTFRRKPITGYLRVPPGPRPVPVAVLFNGTNAVKEEMHWWSEALLERGIATLQFDGPGMGQTFY